ncbi:hypothetical protein [Armatimonas sp.]|uniref:hypothetical protein n=1 Tax=Armatimonas sp. TaxID=1872638 RepID=UPI00374CDDE6
MDNVENTVEEVELTAAEKLAQMEKEKLTRRQALARFGFQAGAAAIAALTADDLLRAVGKEMKQRAGDNKVAQQVAREFHDAGVAYAVAASRTHPWGWGVPGMGSGQVGCNSEMVAGYCGYYFCWPEESEHPNDPLAACVQCCNGVYSGGGNCGSYSGQLQGCLNKCTEISSYQGDPCAKAKKPVEPEA